MGAVTALAAAGMAPDVPAAIMVEDPPPRLVGADADTPMNPDDFADMRAWLGQMKRMTRDELLDYGKARSPTWPDAEFPHWADAKAHMSPNVQMLLDPANRQVVDWPPLLRANQLSCPADYRRSGVRRDHDAGRRRQDEGDDSPACDHPRPWGGA